MLSRWTLARGEAGRGGSVSAKHNFARQPSPPHPHPFPSRRPRHRGEQPVARGGPPAPCDATPAGDAYDPDWTTFDDWENADWEKEDYHIIPRECENTEYFELLKSWGLELRQ